MDSMGKRMTDHQIEGSDFVKQSHVISFGLNVADGSQLVGNWSYNPNTNGTRLFSD